MSGVKPVVLMELWMISWRAGTDLPTATSRLEFTFAWR